MHFSRCTSGPSIHRLRPLAYTESFIQEGPMQGLMGGAPMVRSPVARMLAASMAQPTVSRFSSGGRASPGPVRAEYRKGGKESEQVSRAKPSSNLVECPYTLSCIPAPQQPAQPLHRRPTGRRARDTAVEVLLPSRRRHHRPPGHRHPDRRQTGPGAIWPDRHAVSNILTMITGLRPPGTSSHLPELPLSYVRS